MQASRVFVRHFAGAHVRQKPLALVLARYAPCGRGGGETRFAAGGSSRVPLRELTLEECGMLLNEEHAVQAAASHTPIAWRYGIN
jgi:hypothetical protein